MRLSVLGLVCAGAVAGLLAGGAAARPVPGSEARKLLYPVRGVELTVRDDSGLDAAQIATIEAILKQIKAESAANYYGAVAVSPAFFALMAQDPGAAALSGLLQVAERLHSAEAAGQMALAACNRARKSGHARCVVAAEVLPRNYAARELQMSVEATGAFRAYRKGDGPKAMAISSGTPAWAIGRGEDAGPRAVSECNVLARTVGRADCTIVIED